MKNSSFAFSIFSILIYIFLGCSTTKMASRDLESLKTQTPPPNKALVYVVRPSSYGYAVSMSVSCNNMDLGSTSGKRFIYAFLDTGLYRFVSKAENKAELFLKVEAGKTYFIEQKIKMGLMLARCNMENLNESVGRKKLAICKLSGDCSAYVSAR